MKRYMPKKKDRKALRLARWNKRNCCPECGRVYSQDYLRKWGMCMECYMHDVGMSWRDFI